MFKFKFADHRPQNRVELPILPRSESTSEFQPLEDNEVEYFFASDASAVIEHTNRVIYFEVSPNFIKITTILLFFNLFRMTMLLQ